MSPCEQSRKISAYHDGELSGEQRRHLEEHIRKCSPCAQELEELRSLSRLFAAAEIPEMSFDAMDRLRRSVGFPRQMYALRTAETLMRAAAALLIVCAVWFWQTANHRDPGAEGLQRW